MTSTDPLRDLRPTPLLPVQAGARAAAELRERISAGRLTPGAKLSEEAIAEQLGVSRNTLREAFAALAGESLVDRIPHRGVFVARPNAQDVREIYRTRLIIEPAAVLWGELTDELVASVDSVLETALASREAGDVGAMGDANQLFHRSLVTMTGSATLLTVMDRLLARMRLVFHSMSSQPDFHGHYVAGNVAVWGKIRAGERAAAAESLREYLGKARDELLGYVPTVISARESGSPRPAHR